MARPPDHGRSGGGWAEELLLRVKELKRLDALRERTPRWSPEYAAVNKEVAQQRRHVLEVMDMPRVTVGPKSTGGWQVSGQSQTFKTQTEAASAARDALMRSDGGELVIKGRDGKVREESTIGRPDPRRSKG
jgi:hypothetical protein